MDFQSNVNRLAELRKSLELAVRLSRGWWKQIARDSGCSRHTLMRLASDPDYDPTISEVAKIDAWFQVNGVQRRSPRQRKSKEPPKAVAQVDAFSSSNPAGG